MNPGFWKAGRNAKGNGRFTFSEKLGRYYDLEAPGVYFDDLAPGQETKRTPASYGTMWEGPFNAIRTVRHGFSDPVQAIVGERVASTTLEFVARLEAADVRSRDLRPVAAGLGMPL